MHLLPVILLGTQLTAVLALPQPRKVDERDGTALQIRQGGVVVARSGVKLANTKTSNAAYRRTVNVVRSGETGGHSEAPAGTAPKEEGAPKEGCESGGEHGSEEEKKKEEEEKKKEEENKKEEGCKSGGEHGGEEGGETGHEKEAEPGTHAAHHGGGH